MLENSHQFTGQEARRQISPNGGISADDIRKAVAKAIEKHAMDRLGLVQKMNKI